MTSDSEDKLQTLKSYRRKNGLCFRCGEKWNHNHKCPEQIPLHVLEELWDAVDDESDNQMSDQATQEVEESIMAVHDSDKPMSAKCKTFRFIANVGKDKVLVLIDSGSVGTFVSEQLVQKLKLPTQSCPSATFKAADGGILTCTQMVPEMKWYARGHTFSSTAQVLPLKCFDMILGEDWLEAMSPIWVDYRHKKMKITYEGHRLTLQGIQDIVSVTP
jgi:hypothetical protein